MKQPQLVYLIGAPGVGKSTLMARLTANCTRHPVCETSMPHDLLLRDHLPVGAELGRNRPRFPGTDATPRTIHPKALSWIAGVPYSLVVAEGSRLGTVPFLTTAAGVGYHVSVILLTADDATLAARRNGRGSDQNPSWIKGATTSAMRVADATDALLLDTAGRCPDDLADAVRSAVPALEILL